MKTQIELAIQISLDAWNMQITRFNKLLDSLTDEQLQKQVASNRNSGVYLLGHLTAVHDAMLTTLNLGEKLQPQLEDIYIKNPDQSSLEKPSPDLLRTYWKQVNDALAVAFSKMNTDDWFLRHNSISAEDFIKEPNRNKLNLLQNRTSHIAYHLGQLVFLKEAV